MRGLLIIHGPGITMSAVGSVNWVHTCPAEIANIAISLLAHDTANCLQFAGLKLQAPIGMDKLPQTWHCESCTVGSPSGLSIAIWGLCDWK